MRALNIVIAAGVAALSLASGAAPALAGPTNPDILVGQIGGSAPAARGTLGVQNVTPGQGRTAIAVAPVPTGGAASSKARVSQPRDALDRCEAILKGRAPPVEGLDCSAGQLEKLREQVDAEAAARPSQTVDVDSLASRLKSPGGAAEQTDPTTGAPAIVILTPGQ